MEYTYTEKKRIRKNFGKRKQVIDIPPMLEIQTDSYDGFLSSSSEPDCKGMWKCGTKEEDVDTKSIVSSFNKFGSIDEILKRWIPSILSSSFTRSKKVCSCFY